jgi:hypothetical protein
MVRFGYAFVALIRLFKKPVGEIQYDTMIPAVIFRYKGENCRRIVAIINLDIIVKD